MAAGQTKRRKVPGFNRRVLAANVANLMKHRYRDLTGQPMRLAKDANTSLSTIQRILAGEIGASIDTVEAIATVFDLAAYQLLIPNLRVKNRQVSFDATAAEQNLIEKFFPAV